MLGVYMKDQLVASLTIKSLADFGYPTIGG